MVWGRACGPCPVRAALCTQPPLFPLSPCGNASPARVNVPRPFRRPPNWERAPESVCRQGKVTQTRAPRLQVQLPVSFSRWLAQHRFNAQRWAWAPIPKVSELSPGPNTLAEQALPSDLPKSRAARIDTETLAERA